jgi:hypothetical protein
MSFLAVQRAAVEMRDAMSTWTDESVPGKRHIRSAGQELVRLRFGP